MGGGARGEKLGVASWTLTGALSLGPLEGSVTMSPTIFRIFEVRGFPPFMVIIMVVVVMMVVVMVMMFWLIMKMMIIYNYGLDQSPKLLNLVDLINM